ncbi:MAG: hypothetical protein E7588_03850 [Ruminococcaceae bacterium]|nr:hypothetical protein [Oscillospiraceae bacterium]
MKKIKITPELICAVIFLIIIFLFGATTFANRAGHIYKSIVTPFKYADGFTKTYDKLHESFTKQTEVDSFTENLWNRLFFIDIYSVAQRVTLSVVNEDVSETVVKDNHGLLHFVEPRVDTGKYADRIIGLQNSIDAPILYVQAPNKKLKDYTKLPGHFDNYSNDNADEFLSLIDGKVDYLDLRSELENDALDKTQLFYVTDHHWTTETAFWGFKETVEKIKQNYNIDLDPQGIYTDISNYTAEEYPQSFLGAQGRRVGRFYVGVDDYTLLLPKFNTSFITLDTITSPDKPVSQGDFREAFIDEEILSSDDVSANKHAAYLTVDRGELIIKNELNPDGKKVLMIKDSFAMPYACFMAPCTSETVMIDLRYFPMSRSLSDYINEYQPDVVLFLYNPEVYIDMMFRF